MLDYFPSERPHILAHRGLSLASVENSLEAFRAALSAGATHIETDAHATADGVAILFHDEQLGGRPIWEYQRAELPDYVPTLDAALETFPYARFNIDIKSLGAISAVSTSVNAHRAHDRVLIASFSLDRRKRTQEKILGATSSASALEFALALWGAKLGLQWLVNRALGRVDAIQIPIRAAGMKTITPKTMKAFKAAHVVVHVWTINDPDEMRLLVNLGVDGIVTDRSDLAYKEFYTR